MLEKYTCDNCGTDFLDYPSKHKNYKNTFCSTYCHNAFRRHRVEKECIICGEQWTAVGANSKESRRSTCSNECHLRSLQETTFKKGDRPWNYKGYRVSTQGYVFISAPDHPNVNSNGYVKRANLVMEQVLGRYLKPGEVIHHINGDKLDDSPENLMLFGSNSEHIKYHNELKKREETQ